ncbi:hypothetical protein ACFO4O_12970 [Glaciecola siphonariae]|uniref:Uncharacterized protein n=1 Tax=Glaciecola siphonariae TaxID=521012 RepID=A0ABV9M0C3_9ALTE
MKHKINLYHQDFRPRFEWVTAQHLVALVFMSVLVCGGVFAGLYSWRTAVETDVENIAQRVSQEQRNIDEFTSALQTRVNNPILGAKLNKLQQQISAQETLLMRVQDMGELKQKSFAQLFNALATADSDHVWLNQFTVNENDLVIRGSLARPSALTQWIGDLSKTQFFNGQEFDDALLIREDGELSFHLTSTQKTDDVLVADGGSNASN